MVVMVVVMVLVMVVVVVSTLCCVLCMHRTAAVHVCIPGLKISSAATRGTPSHFGFAYLCGCVYVHVCECVRVCVCACVCVWIASGRKRTSSRKRTTRSPSSASAAWRACHRSGRLRIESSCRATGGADFTGRRRARRSSSAKSGSPPPSSVRPSLHEGTEKGRCGGPWQQW